MHELRVLFAADGAPTTLHAACGAEHEKRLAGTQPCEVDQPVPARAVVELEARRRVRVHGRREEALAGVDERDIGGGLDSGVATVRASTAGAGTASVARSSPDFVIDESQLRALALVSDEADEPFLPLGIDADLYFHTASRRAVCDVFVTPCQACLSKTMRRAAGTAAVSRRKNPTS